MNKKLLIIGAGGHGKVVADIAMKMNKWDEIAFLDNDENLKSVLGLSILDKSDNVLSYIDEYEIFVATGNNSTRQKVYEMLFKADANIPTLIHPNAVIGKEVKVEVGTVIMAGVVINSSTQIGTGCIINTGATVDHDNIIENYVHVSPGVHIAGTVKIKQGTWLGIGCVISNNINIANMSIIGAGA